MLAALLLPVVDFLDRRGAPRGGAVALVLLGGFAVVGGILTFVVSQFIQGAPALVDQVTTSMNGVRDWLTTVRCTFNNEQIDQFRKSAIEALQNNQAKLTSGALSTAGTIDRDRHRRTAGVLHADLRAARRTQHLRVRHQDLPGRASVTGCATPAGPASTR